MLIIITMLAGIRPSSLGYIGRVIGRLFSYTRCERSEKTMGIIMILSRPLYKDFLHKKI
jgi:hypothetical protein